MITKYLLLFSIMCLSSFEIYANVKTSATIIDFQKEPTLKALNENYKKELNQKELLALKEKTIQLSGKSVPVLVKVMKSSEYPDKNRWVATFLLGRIVGKKSAPFIAKFGQHPSWVMRMASLKTLLALKANEFGPVYADSLKDPSLLVRLQALENIRSLKLKNYAPQVWAMLYDKQNYYNVKNVYKRTNIIKNIIKSVGDLELQEAKKPMLTMISDKKYEDIFDELDYSLSQITKKTSPKTDRGNKKIFWSRLALADAKI